MASEAVALHLADSGLIDAIPAGLVGPATQRRRRRRAFLLAGVPGSVQERGASSGQESPRRALAMAVGGRRQSTLPGGTSPLGHSRWRTSSGGAARRTAESDASTQER